MARWEAARWPGNVRELRIAVTRHFALGTSALDSEPTGAMAGGAEGGSTEEALKPFDPFDDVIAEGLPLIESRQRMIEAFERRYLAAALATTGGNVTRAARVAGIPRRYFQTLRAKRLRSA
jgi:DNA-binding NtrC family response regulator